MLRRLFIGLVLILGAGVAAASTGALIGSLTDQLGVSKKQARGGAGSLFSYAKDNLSADDFSALSGAVPGVDRLIKKAPSVGGASSATSAASSLLGGSSGGSSALSGAMDQLGGTALVAEQFSKLGMDAGMVQQFLPIVLDYVEETGGQAAMDIMKSAF